MSVKRSRIIRSSSFGDTGVAPPQPTPTTDSELLYHVTPSVAFSRTSGTPNPLPGCAARTEVGPRRPGILAVSSPVTEECSGGEEAVGNFLERCYYCKKRFDAKEDIFMYGYLRAFCTSDCRDNQMIMDRIQDQSAIKSSEGRSGSCGMTKWKD